MPVSLICRKIIPSLPALAVLLMLGGCGDGAGKDLPTNVSSFPAVNYSVRVTADKNQVKADGSDTATITAYVMDADRGIAAGDGTVITFSTTWGSMTGWVRTSGGIAEADIFSYDPGTATVTAVAPDGTYDSVTVVFKNYS